MPWLILYHWMIINWNTDGKEKIEIISSKETFSGILLMNGRFYTPPHFSVGVLCYTFRCLSVRPSVLTISDW